jgi:hypothetical protein
MEHMGHLCRVKDEWRKDGKIRKSKKRFLFYRMGHLHRASSNDGEVKESKIGSNKALRHRDGQQTEPGALSHADINRLVFHNSLIRGKRGHTRCAYALTPHICSFCHRAAICEYVHPLSVAVRRSCSRRVIRERGRGGQRRSSSSGRRSGGGN